MIKITTWNVNGLRAATRKGFLDFVDSIDPDILMLQEVRALPEQLSEEVLKPAGYHALWHPAEKKGYSGVAIWSKRPISVIGVGMDGADPEGRVLRCRVGKLQVISTYLPSGSSGEARQQVKDQWMRDYIEWVEPFVQGEEPVIIGGDLNIAHTANDIHNPTGNKKTSGFLPHEREWFTSLLDRGWTDLHRTSVGEQKGPYSWWSNRGRARELDRGWRIDYLIGNAAATAKLKRCFVTREGGLTVSDHAPVTAEFSFR